MQTAINFIKRFFHDFARSIYFAAYEYDQKLQNTKTTKQRIFIWTTIFALVGVIIFLVIYFVWKVLDDFDVSRYY